MHGGTQVSGKSDCLQLFATTVYMICIRSLPSIPEYHDYYLVLVDHEIVGPMIGVAEDVLQSYLYDDSKT
jgi:hypothetical protein